MKVRRCSPRHGHQTQSCSLRMPAGGVPSLACRLGASCRLVQTLSLGAQETVAGNTSASERRHGRAETQHCQGRTQASSAPPSPGKPTGPSRPVSLVSYNSTTERGPGFPIKCFQHFHTSLRSSKPESRSRRGSSQRPSVRMAEETNNTCENPSTNYAADK